jgi:hypothetical protein
VIAAGLALSLASAVAINGGYSLQHASASRLPPLSLRRPLKSLFDLLGARRWLVGFLCGVGGWVLYVTSLKLAPLSLVQAASAGGIGVLALGGGRLRPAERVGVGAALGGLLLLGLSLGSHPTSDRGTVGVVVLWLVVSAGAAALVIRVLPAGPGFGTAAGVLYAAGDVATKAAVGGGARLWFIPPILLCHLAAFVCMQAAFQRGGRLGTAGLAVLWTNALPIVAGTIVFGESLPGGFSGTARVAAFVLVLIGAAALSRPPIDAPEQVATLSID